MVLILLIFLFFGGLMPFSLGAQDEGAGWKFQNGVTFGESGFAADDATLRISFPGENILSFGFYISPYTGVSGSEAVYKELSAGYSKGFKSGFSVRAFASFAPPVEGYQTLGGGTDLGFGFGEDFFTEIGLEGSAVRHSQETASSSASAGGSGQKASSSSSSSGSRSFSQLGLAPRIRETFFGITTLSASVCFNKYLINEDKGNFSVAGRQKNLLSSTSGFVNTCFDLGLDQTITDFFSAYLGYSRISYLTADTIDHSVLFELTFHPSEWLELSPGINGSFTGSGTGVLYYSLLAGFSW